MSYNHKSFAEFKNKMEHQEKDKKWESDVKMYQNWKNLRDKYNSEIGKNRCKEIQTKWPNHLFE